MQRRAQLWRRDPRWGALVIAFGIAAAAFVALTAAVLLAPAFMSLDERISAAVRDLSSPVLDAVFRSFTALGGAWPIAVLTVGVFAILQSRGRFAEAVYVVAAVPSGWLVGEIVRLLVERVRPGLELARIPLPDSYSFPSGHALGSFLFFGAVFFVVVLEAKRVSTRVWTLAVCVAMAAGVALSRVYFGVHWFGDILASWILGAAWLTLCAAVYVGATTDGSRQATSGR